MLLVLPKLVFILMAVAKLYPARVASLIVTALVPVFLMYTCTVAPGCWWGSLGNCQGTSSSQREHRVWTNWAPRIARAAWAPRPVRPIISASRNVRARQREDWIICFI